MTQSLCLLQSSPVTGSVWSLNSHMLAELSCVTLELASPMRTDRFCTVACRFDRQSSEWKK